MGADPAAAGTPARLAIDGLRFRYPGPDGFELALDELRATAGETLVCIGPSGSGKTTLLHLLAGILAPAAGRVRIDGDDLTALGPAARRRFRLQRIGLVFQEFELLEHLTVRENVLLPYLMGLGRDAAAADRAGELAAATGIGHLLRRRPSRISQGERQRVAICRALCTAPALVLADEPTGNLDPRSAGQVLDLLLEQATARGATVVTVTHDHAVLGRFDRVLDLAQPAAAGALR
ncbi:MAG: ABC transporter ATP-binding protein [Planctomycetes bacterium]|nr:ABC transporter ATP-binding protein [Planctomycetota bacterium]